MLLSILYKLKCKTIKDFLKSKFSNGFQKPVGELKEAGREFDNLLTKSKGEIQQ